MNEKTVEKMSEQIRLRTMKQYADECGISYESVRRKVVKYKNELEGHIHVDHRVTFLDDFAISFLNEHRKFETIVIQEENLETMREVEELREKVEQLQRQLLSSKDLVIQLQQENNNYLLESAELKAIQFDFERYKEAMQQKEAEYERLKEELRTQNAELVASLEASKDELERYRRLRWWQKLFK